MRLWNAIVGAVEWAGEKLQMMWTKPVGRASIIWFIIGFIIGRIV